jgi:hypothetical protein
MYIHFYLIPADVMAFRSQISMLHVELRPQFLSSQALPQEKRSVQIKYVSHRTEYDPILTLEHWAYRIQHFLLKLITVITPLPSLLIVILLKYYTTITTTTTTATSTTISITK